jgi:hypothetical protein
MNSVDNLDKAKIPVVKINDDLKKYRNQPNVLKKLKRMNDILEEIGMPEEYYRQQELIEKRKQAASIFWIKGIVSHADMRTNSFSLVVKGTDNLSELQYTITTLSSEVLTQLLKDYKDDMINVHIKQKEQSGEGCEYELIEVGR